MSRKYFVDDPMSSWLTLLAGTQPVDRLAAMRLIVTPGAIIDAHAEAECKGKEHDDDDGTAARSGADRLMARQWPPGTIDRAAKAVYNVRISLFTRANTM
jgi:hypothetical protein